MSSSLLSFKMMNIREYEGSSISFSFMPLQRVYDDVESDSPVREISPLLYENKIISIAGVNASGKSTLLSIIAFVLGLYLDNRNLKDYKELLNRLYNGHQIDLEVLYAVEGSVFKVRSKIELSGGEYVFAEETLFSFKGRGKTKKELFEDNMFSLEKDRSTLDNKEKTFLEDDKSISYMSIKKQSGLFISYIDAKHTTQEKEINSALSPLITYLDSSIEKFEKLDENLFLLKRKGQEEEVLNYFRLEAMLSSGTLRALSLFSSLVEVLKSGGYLLLDEAEMHFNKTIVVNLFEIFMRKSTNPNGAHLVFTTHYNELLDLISRNDSIYIVSRSDNGFLDVKNLSLYLKRKDVKKSEILFSDYYDMGTTVDYWGYRNLIKTIESAIIAKTEGQ